MALVLAEGFRHVPGAYDRIVSTIGSLGTFSRVTGKASGLYALSHASSNATETFDGNIRIPIMNNQFALGCSVNYAKMAASNFGPTYTGLELLDTGGQYLANVNLTTGYPIGSQASIYGSMTGTSTWSVKDATPFTQGWHWIVATCKWADGSTGFFRVYRDGVLCVEMAPDTQSTQGYQAGYMRIYMGNSNASATSGMVVGDIVLYTGETPIIPEQRVDVLVPDGTNTNQWVGSDADSVNNHLLVDDPGPTIDTSDYVQSSTVGATDEYTFTNLPHNPTTVAGVQVSVIANRTEAGPRSLAPVVNGQEGTTYDPGSQGSLVQVYQTNPSGGAAWSAATVNSMTAGMRIKA